MLLDAIVIYFFISVAAMGLLALLFLRFHFGVAEMETKITGIWSNRDDSMRVLIYNINSQVQGEVVWTDKRNDKILGTTIIKGMHLKFFGWSKGVYIDPLTKDQFSLKLKLKNSGNLLIHLSECDDDQTREQKWSQIK